MPELQKAKRPPGGGRSGYCSLALLALFAPPLVELAKPGARSRRVYQLAAANAACDASACREARAAVAATATRLELQVPAALGQLVTIVGHCDAVVGPAVATAGHWLALVRHCDAALRQLLQRRAPR